MKKTFSLITLMLITAVATADVNEYQNYNANSSEQKQYSEAVSEMKDVRDISDSKAAHYVTGSVVHYDFR